MIFTGAILLALIVTIICILIQRNINKDDGYDEFLNEEGDHEYYDRISIRYKPGIFIPKESCKMK